MAPTFVKILQVSATDSNEENKSKIANVIDLKSKKSPEIPPHVREASKDDEIMLVTPIKAKTLTNKKKNSLMAKRRKVNLTTLSLSATIQGHLYRRAKDKTEVAYWTKLYFVLMETSLYGFKNAKDSTKADCVIFLSGFTVSLAKEVHSKRHSFKVYHPKKTFYFAAETAEALSQWMDYIKQATLKGNANSLDCETKDLYSETECSEDENEISMCKQQFTSPSSMENQDKSLSTEQFSTSSFKSYHLNFGSLKKFARGSSNASNANAESSSPSDHKFLGFFTSNKSDKKSGDIVPSATFKTYKKVKESSGGLQLGATSMINYNISDMNSGSYEENATSTAAGRHESYQRLEKPKHFMEIADETSSSMETSESSLKKMRKTHNYLHASNPNLLDYEFHQTIDFPTASNTQCNWDQQTEPAITLLDLMLQQRAEEMKRADMYNRRVEHGIEHGIEKAVAVPAVPFPPVTVNPQIQKIQKRSLPITPDFSESFSPDDRAILYARSKEGLKLRDFGYELISGDDSNVQKASSAWPPKRSDKIQPAASMKKKSSLNWMMPEAPEPDISCLGQSSFRNGKSLKLFSTSTLPSKSKQSQQQGGNQPTVNLKKSNTCHTPTDFNVGALSNKVLRKNSAPSASVPGIPYFSKLSFSTASQKKILGSPKLSKHRAIFGKNNSTSSGQDHEIFAPITFQPKVA